MVSQFNLFYSSVAQKCRSLNTSRPHKQKHWFRRHSILCILYILVYIENKHWPQRIMSDLKTLEPLYAALKAVNALRNTVGEMFRWMVDLPQNNPNVSDFDFERSKKSITNQMETFHNALNSRYNNLEAACMLLSTKGNAINLGNTHLVGQDPNYDKTSLYPDMIISYRWLDNMHEYSLFAFQALQTHFTKRNSMAKNRIRVRTINNHNIASHNIDHFLSSLQRMFVSDMSVEVLRPFGIFSILKVAINRTLRAVIVLRGYFMEWVLVKGYDEMFDEINPNQMNKPLKPSHLYAGNLADMSNLKLDIWTKSRYQIFRTITEHANAALIHFYAPLQMENAIKAYLNWLKGYAKLFETKCRKCDTHLLNNMPPTWRDFRTNEPYHFECRP